MPKKIVQAIVREARCLATGSSHS